MSQPAADKYQVFFDDPRLRMTIAGRFSVRVISAIMSLVLFGAMIAFFMSDIHRVRAAGFFLALFLIDRFVHRKQGDVPISELPVSGKINLAAITSPTSFSSLGRAYDKAAFAHQNFYLAAANQFMGFPQIEEGLTRLDVNPKEFKQKLEELLQDPATQNKGSKEDCLKQVELLAMFAFEGALSTGRDFIHLTNFFSALAKVKDGPIERLFQIFSIEPGDLEKAMIFSARGIRRNKIPVMLGGLVLESHKRIQHKIMNRAWTSVPTPMLDRYSEDLTDLARAGQIGFLVGHDAEYERLVETLSRPINPNAMLVGEAGAGKETMIEHLAYDIVRDRVPKALFDKRLVCLGLQNLVAGAPPDELTARIKVIVEEIYQAGNVILYIPEIHNLVRTSGTAYLSAADALMPVIMNNAFPIVGTSYPKEFKQLIEPRSDVVGAFDIIHVNEMSVSDAEKLLTYSAMILERGSGITVSFGAVKRAVILAKKYFGGKLLPASAEELLKSAFIDAEHRGEKMLGPDRITAVAESKVNIPMHEAKGDEAEKLLNMEEIIHGRLVDQEEAVKAVSQALREYRSGLVRKGGPIASFLFVGPTGVGKTELAKILADIQFGSEKLMVRFDMTEYQDKTSFFRFIGTPDGQTHGALTDAILEKPYSLILLDEFEKAYPDILNLFLQVLDDGRLTDNLGRTVDFSNTIIIATSNAHSDIINEALAKGESMANIEDYLKKRLVDVFKPELLNRFSKVIIFKNLEPKDLGRIVDYNLREIVAITKEQGIFMEFSPEAIAEIAKLGFDPAFGARPLRRVIDEKVRAPLSEAILSKKITKGDRVKFVFVNSAFDFVPQGAAPVTPPPPTTTTVGH